MSWQKKIKSSEMDINQIKERKMQDIQDQLQSQAEEAQLQEQIEQIEAIAKSRMTSDALVRYGNVKVAHPEKAIQVLIILSQFIQSGKVNKIDDKFLKVVLERITQKREFKIRRK